MPVRRTRKSRSTVKDLAKDIKDIRNQISKADVKRKLISFDGNQASAQLSTLSQNCGIFNKINEIGVGTADDQCVGNAYTLKNIKLNLLLHNTSGIATIVRYCVLRTNQQIGNTGPNLFLNDSGNGQTYSDTFTGGFPIQKDRYRFDFNSNKFDIIMHGRCLLGANNSVATNNFLNNKMLRKRKSYKGKKEFLNSSGVPDTNYYLVMFNVNTSMDNSSAVVEVSGNTVFEFTDM